MRPSISSSPLRMAYVSNGRGRGSSCSASAGAAMERRCTNRRGKLSSVHAGRRSPVKRPFIRTPFL